VMKQQYGSLKGGCYWDFKEGGGRAGGSYCEDADRHDALHEDAVLFPTRVNS